MGGESNPNGSSFESITWACGLLAATQRINVFCTVHVPLHHPVAAAKQMATADHIGQGHLGVNVACGWNAVVALGPIGTRQGELDPRIRRLHAKSPQRVWVYEAGPCGYGRSRELTKKGHGCGVVAPAFIPPQPGERGTPHRRAAMTRARLRRAGDLPAVYVPRLPRGRDSGPVPGA
jgi:Luciferase-like monooxygenase